MVNYSFVPRYLIIIYVTPKVKCYQKIYQFLSILERTRLTLWTYEVFAKYADDTPSRSALQNKPLNIAY